MTPADPDDLRRAFAGWGGTAGALLAGGRGVLPLGALRPRAAAALDRRPPRAPRRRLPSDAALSRPGRHHGARGRLGAGGGARPGGGPGRRARRLCRGAAAARPRASSARRRGTGGSFTCGPGLRGPAQAALAAASRAGAGLAGRPLRLALRRRRDREANRRGLTARAGSANLAGPRRGRRAECSMPAFLTSFFQVIMIDLVLAGDNAVVIGLAAAGLPHGAPPQGDHHRHRRRHRHAHRLRADRDAAAQPHRPPARRRPAAALGVLEDVPGAARRARGRRGGGDGGADGERPQRRRHAWPAGRRARRCARR